MTDTSDSPGEIRWNQPEESEWDCLLFGMDGTMVITPKKGGEPNWFWRWMQYLAFGNKWVRRKTP